MGLNLLFQKPHVSPAGLDSPVRSSKPICSHRGKESLHFSVTIILTKAFSNE